MATIRVRSPARCATDRARLAPPRWPFELDRASTRELPPQQATALWPRALRQPQPPLAAPDADHANVTRIDAVDDANRWANQLAQDGGPELRHHPPHLRVIDQRFDACQDITDQLFRGRPAPPAPRTTLARPPGRSAPTRPGGRRPAKLASGCRGASGPGRATRPGRPRDRPDPRRRPA